MHESDCGISIAWPIGRGEGIYMMVATALAVLVVFCLFLSMVENPPDVGR
jgi:hypothetical protein